MPPAHEALEASLRIHRDAWYDGQNLKRRLEREGPQPLLALLNALEAPWRLRLDDWKGEWICGSLGPEAHNILSFLDNCGMSVWKVLPVGPTQSDGSPYQTTSVHAGNPQLIALEPLQGRGWLQAPVENDTVEAKYEALRRSWDGFPQRAADTDRHRGRDRAPAARRG